jgi:cytochrome c oxidase subunit 1
VLYQHFFWFYSHPAVYIMILPAMGIISELISVHSRKHIFGYKFIAYSSHRDRPARLPRLGPPHVRERPVRVSSMIFSFLTFFVAIPSAIKVFNWLATMYKGSISLNDADALRLAFIFLFGIGGLTGSSSARCHRRPPARHLLRRRALPLRDGRRHVFAFLGGLHHWWPKMFGRMYSETWGESPASSSSSAST